MESLTKAWDFQNLPVCYLICFLITCKGYQLSKTLLGFIIFSKDLSICGHFSRNCFTSATLSIFSNFSLLDLVFSLFSPWALALQAKHNHCSVWWIFSRSCVIMSTVCLSCKCSFIDLSVSNFVDSPVCLIGDHPCLFNDTIIFHRHILADMQIHLKISRTSGQIHLPGYLALSSDWHLRM